MAKQFKTNSFQNTLIHLSVAQQNNVISMKTFVAVLNVLSQDHCVKENLSMTLFGKSVAVQVLDGCDGIVWG